MKSFFQRIIKERFRITFFHDDFKPLFSLRFTIFSFVLSVIGFATLIIIITIFIIAKTTLREYIPGYGTNKERKMLLTLLNKMDSLQQVANNKNLYLQAILKAFNGDTDSTFTKQTTKSVLSNTLNLKASATEVKIRKEIEKSIISNNTTSFKFYNNNISNISFLPPTKGIITSNYNKNIGHYGIDIAGKNEEPVRSIFKGIVLYADYSVLDGNSVIILHPDGWVSVYKHLSTILKSAGNYVNSNEIIGTMGNTGTASNGVHLHFELWYKQTPVNPIEYIIF